MIGIYCYQNIINNKCYIGQSRNLESRKQQHKRNYTNKNLDSYNTKFYRTIRKYGWSNFKYTILFQTDNLAFSQSLLNDLEILFIKIKDSFQNGYNMNKGGRFTSSQKVLTDDVIVKIWDDIYYTKTPFKTLARKYNVSISLISQINSGNIWNESCPYSYPIRKNVNKVKSQGQNNGNAKFTNNQILEIRMQFVNKTLDEIYEIYKSFCSFSELKKIVYGAQFKNLPIYKKRERKWYLCGTCIDYPRLEEQKNQ